LMIRPSEYLARALLFCAKEKQPSVILRIADDGGRSAGSCSKADAFNLTPGSATRHPASVPVLRTVDGCPGPGARSAPAASRLSGFEQRPGPPGGCQTRRAPAHWPPQLACKLRVLYTTLLVLGSALLAGKSTQPDDAANLVTQACSGHPFGSSERRISRHSGVPSWSSCGG
jgi:hypothetical protein